MSRKPVYLLFTSLIALAGAMLCSLLLGRTAVGWGTLTDAFFHYDPGNVEQLIVRTERLSRTIIASAAGAALALAGALMQALTRNPLAASDVFGINAGAIFFVVAGVLLFPSSPLLGLAGYAVIGALVSAAVVYGLGSLGLDGLTPVKLILAGAAITALFTSFTQGMLVLNESGFQDVLFWLAGSVSGRELQTALPVLPFILAAAFAAILMGRAVNLLNSGEDIAKGLGQNTLIVKLAIGVLVVVLAGGSVAIVGAVGFVGLVVPHLARSAAGSDYRWVLPISAVFGAVLLLLADVAARLAISPGEIPIGVMTAVIGVPFFVHAARKGGVWR